MRQRLHLVYMLRIERNSEKIFIDSYIVAKTRSWLEIKRYILC